MAAGSIKDWIKKRQHYTRQSSAADAKHQKAFKKLLEHATLQRQWTDAFRSIFPPGQTDQYSVTDVRNGKITIHVGDSASATRLRFQAPEILQKLSVLQDFAGSEELNVRINPSTTPTKPSKKGIGNRPPGHILRALAADIPDPNLRKSVLKLAEHGIAKPLDDLGRE